MTDLLPRARPLLATPANHRQGCPFIVTLRCGNALDLDL